MTRQLHKVVYKPNSQSTDEYIVIVNKAEYEKWKAGDTSISLALIVDSFSIFHTGQGSQGVLGRISKQMLDTVFGTQHEDEAVKIVLEKGALQPGDAIDALSFRSKNDSRGTYADGGR